MVSACSSYLSLLVFVISVSTTFSQQSTGYGYLRLTPLPGSSNQQEGLLEIYINGQWGTVCDSLSSFSQFYEGTIACQQLGFRFYEGVRRINPANQPLSWLRNIDCTSGNPSTLLKCGSSELGSLPFSCSDGRLVVLRCSGCVVTCPNGTCAKPSMCDGSLRCPDEPNSCLNEPRGDSIEHQDGDWRLVRGSLVEDGLFGVGRLEVFISGKWGTVCDSSAFNAFSPFAANIACKQLGYQQYASYGRIGTLRNDRSIRDNYPLASNNVPVHLERVYCHSGYDTDLLRCHHLYNALGFSTTSCSHSSDIGLNCSHCDQFLCGDGSCVSSCRECPVVQGDCEEQPTTLPQVLNIANEGDLRLVPGQQTNGYTAGRLEIYMAGQWGTICASTFTKVEADIACKQLGFQQSREFGASVSSRYPQEHSSVPVWLRSVRCGGFTDHQTLLSCDTVASSGHGSSFCSLVGLNCSSCDRFLCPEGTCVPECDGSRDCRHGEDEDSRTCVVMAVANMYGRQNAIMVFLSLIVLIVGVSVLVVAVCWCYQLKKSPRTKGHYTNTQLETSDQEENPQPKEDTKV